MGKITGFLLALAVFSACGQAGAGTGVGTVDPRLCQLVTKHTPSADVAYQPGVDVNGKKVVPADLAGNAVIDLPTKYDIPVTANLFKILSLSATNSPFNKSGQTDINLGTLTVDGDRVSFNGKPLSASQQDNLAVLCLRPR